MSLVSIRNTALDWNGLKRYVTTLTALSVTYSGVSEECFLCEKKLATKMGFLCRHNFIFRALFLIAGFVFEKFQKEIGCSSSALSLKLRL